jgi:hypothetical protein
MLILFDLFVFFIDRGDMHPALWGFKVGNSWRTTNDITDTWERLINFMFLFKFLIDHSNS